MSLILGCLFFSGTFGKSLAASVESVLMAYSSLSMSVKRLLKSAFPPLIVKADKTMRVFCTEGVRNRIFLLTSPYE